jgi:hypothetical protein
LFCFGAAAVVVVTVTVRVAALDGSWLAREPTGRVVVVAASALTWVGAGVDEPDDMRTTTIVIAMLATASAGNRASRGMRGNFGDELINARWVTAGGAGPFVRPAKS